MSEAYRQSGVDVEAGYSAVSMIKQKAEATFDGNVLNSLGSFGAFYALPSGMEQPVLVSGTDGVGTKLRIAMAMDKHDTVGQDLVAMCVNDIICHGAKPLYFLDYIALGKLVPERVAEIVGGVAEGCRLAGCALIGGETAEMPGMYAEDDYDLAGFAVGIVDKPKVIDGSRIQAGDIVLGLESSGVHSNGFSLVRKVFPPSRSILSKHAGELGMTLGDALLQPTKIYVNAVQACIQAADVHGIAHITGGGLYENIPRIIPDGLCARVDANKWQLPPVFSLLASKSGLEADEMAHIFNMGIGMAVAVPEADAQAAIGAIAGAGETAHVIGEIAEGGQKLELRA